MGKNLGKKIGKGVGVVILAVAVGVGVFFGCRMAHDKGYEAGLAAGRAEKDDKIEELAKAVVAKNQVLKVLDDVAAPATVTDANIDEYLKDLEAAETKLREMEEGEIADLLVTYKGAWDDFKVAYASRDNELIKSEFEKIKTAHGEFVTKAQEILDGRIK